MNKKIEKEILDYVRLKDKLDVLNKFDAGDSITENPVDRLTFRNQIKENKQRQKNNLLFSAKFWLSVLVVVLLCTSIFLDSLFLHKLDPAVYKIIRGSVFLGKRVVSAPKNFLIDQFQKPYVLTIGEYGNLTIAKDEALKLLPQFKQINIKELKSGIYTFEIERFSSKKKAYLLSEQFKQNGFESVHVRYLLNQ